MIEVWIMEQSNIFRIEYSMEYVFTLWLPDNYIEVMELMCGHGILDLKSLNPSIFHHWYNYTNVDLVHHMFY